MLCISYLMRTMQHKHLDVECQDVECKEAPTIPEPLKTVSEKQRKTVFDLIYNKHCQTKAQSHSQLIKQNNSLFFI